MEVEFPNVSPSNNKDMVILGILGKTLTTKKLLNADVAVAVKDPETDP
jgi:hypothetical protein